MDKQRIDVNRSAESGGEIIADTNERNWPKENGRVMPVALRVEDTTVIAVIESPSMTNVGWYVGRTLDIGFVLLAQVSKLELASGVVTAINGMR